MRILLAFLLLLSAGCAKKVSSSGNWESISKLNLFTEHNIQREKYHLASFQMNLDLDFSAQKHAQWMAARNKLTHQGFENRVEGKWMTMGENIAWNQVTEAQVVEDWMNSSGHRANILNKSFVKIGFGYAEASDGSLYWCVIFGG